ncbi:MULTISPECIES: hypothetical protein [Sphingomonas]|uniref:Uncharacterized protein n=1 Tax=Sphingomonas trueperi TaxID=53317 RepID=A0A7X6BF47_9SPHN|nr:MULTISPECIES: hypothetical protein [Sphingomonas]NJC00006.1 hypothetical protein [Sphingomonas trueperi]
MFDDASDPFARIQHRLAAQRRGGGGNIGGFLDLGARFDTRGIGDSLARDAVNRVTAGASMLHWVAMRSSA